MNEILEYLKTWPLCTKSWKLFDAYCIAVLRGSGHITEALRLRSTFELLFLWERRTEFTSKVLTSSAINFRSYGGTVLLILGLLFLRLSIPIDRDEGLLCRHFSRPIWFRWPSIPEASNWYADDLFEPTSFLCLRLGCNPFTQNGHVFRETRPNAMMMLHSSCTVFAIKSLD